MITPRKLLAISLLLVSLASTYAVQDQSDWVKFTSPKGLFSVLLPHEPKLDETSSDAGHSRFNDFEERYGFVVEYFESATYTDPDVYLDGTLDGVIRTVKGTVVSQRKISLNEHPGREVEISITAANGIVVLARTRIYLVGKNLFSLTYLHRKDMDSTRASEIGEKFFLSLKIK